MKLSANALTVFSDMADLDRLAAQEYTPEIIVAISKSLAKRKQNIVSSSLDTESAKELAAQARTESIGMVQLILNTMEAENHEQIQF